MKIAYAITLHHKPYQFEWLFAAIDSADDVFCIHVDLKSPPEFDAAVRRLVAGRPNVHLLPRRRAVWGGWSQVVIELDAIALLLERDAGWRYLINLSGQDYPIKAMAEIRRRLAEAWPNNFIRAWPFADIARTEPHDPHLEQRVAVEMFGRMVRTPLRRPLAPTLQFKGSSWHMLTRDFCEWALRDPMVRRIAAPLKHTYSPDETYFQSLVMNGPWRDRRTQDMERLVIWPGPKTLRMEDYPVLSASTALFARKFDERVDRDVLVRLGRDCQHPSPRSESLVAAGA